MASFRVRRGSTIRIDVRLQRPAGEEDSRPEDAQQHPQYPAYGPPDQPAAVMGAVTLIISYTASSMSITAGQTVTFSFEVTPHTTSLKLVNVSTGAETDLTGAIPAGSTTVTPSGPSGGSSVVRQYKLVADGSYGHHEEQTISITVAPNNCQVINSFTATPAVVIQGQTIHLAWTSTNGTSATLKDLLTNGQISVGLNSSLNVTPASSRSYRLTVNGPCAAVTQDVAVTIMPGCQTITSYSASPTTIAAGGSTTISWATTNATQVTLTDMTSGAVDTLAASGSIVKSPATTRTYRLTVTGACTTLTQDITITVT